MDLNEKTFMKSIYLLATERSGSNLIRVMLGNHSKIAAPLPANCFKLCHQNLIYYDYQNTIAYQKIVEDIVSIVNHPFSQWNLETAPKKIYEKYKPNSLVKSFSAVYGEHAVSEGKEAFFSKDIANIKYAPIILKEEPKAKFIYLYRDPRDVVSSRIKGGIFSNSVYQNARFWKDEQETCISLALQFPDNIHLVKYEDLISGTKETMDGVLGFLDLEIEESCYNTGQTGNHKRHDQSELWKNLSKSIIKDNTKKYKSFLSEKETNIVESIAGDFMRYFGYTDFDTKADFKYKTKSFFFLKENLKKVSHRIKSKRQSEKKSKYMREKIHFMTEVVSKRQKEWREQNQFSEQ